MRKGTTNSYGTSQNGSSASENRERLAKGLGWFSIGLGAAELFMPGGVAGLIGIRNTKPTRRLLRTYGLREMAAGVGILSQERPAGWLWGRVAGDVVDLATLGSAMTSDDTKRVRLATATAAVLGVTALDLICGKQLSAQTGEDGNRRTRRVGTSVRINRTPEDVYRYWRRLEHLPGFMNWVESVQTFDDRRSHWCARVPGGMNIEWDAEIVDDKPNQRIAWRSVEGSDVQISGGIQFDPAPGGRGTLVFEELRYIPPMGQKAVSLFGKIPLRTVLHNDLRRFKQILETGEIVQSDASIHKGMHPAQPPSIKEAISEHLQVPAPQPSMA